MKILSKSLLGAGAAAAALVGAVPAAQARDNRGDGISAGEVIAGALVLGGIAAVIASSDNDRNRGYDDRYYDPRYGDGRYDNNRGGYGYNNQGNSRQAVNQCVGAVERWAAGYARSDVTQISDIDRTRNGYRVKGKIVVQDSWRGNGRNGRYDRDNRNGYNRGYDQGSFTCKVEYGRVVDIDYKGLDRWR
jgi:hypothetical protein